MSSYSSHPYALLASNGILLGFGCCMQLIGSWTGLYYIFTDNQIYLFNGCMLAGAGIGLIPISIIFYFFEPVYGWRVAQRMTSVLFIGTILFVVSLIYPVRKLLGIRTRDEKYEDMRKRLRSDSEHSPMLSGATCSGSHEKDSIDSNEHDVIAVGSMVASSTHSNDVGFLGPLKYAMRHYGYFLVLVSFVFSSQAFDTAMVQQPVRMNALGIAKKQGALALAINGVVQLIIRVSVGLVCSWGVITPIRISQIAKLTFVLSTFASIFLKGELFQTIYYFTLGFGGAILNTADFFLVKEALKKHREFAVTLQLSIAGILTLIFMPLMGYLYEKLGTYEVGFGILTALFAVGFFPSILYEINLRKQLRKTSTTSMWCACIHDKGFSLFNIFKNWSLCCMNNTIL